MSSFPEWYTLAKGETTQWRKGPFLQTRYKIIMTREVPETTDRLDRLLLFESILEEAVQNIVEDGAPEG